MENMRIAVVGGSIAGCAAALAVHRAGAGEVVVFERTVEQLEDRGVGLGISSGLYKELELAEYLSPALPSFSLRERKWIVAEGDLSGGRIVGTQGFEFRTYNWGSLWRFLRDALPKSVNYRAGCRVVEVADGSRCATVTLTDGTVESFDAIIGADGYRSIVRAALFPGIYPRYAGYLLWRGTLPAVELPRRDEYWKENDAVAVAFPQGHMMMYAIPGKSGGRILNWAVYSVPTDAPDLQLEDPTSLPPGLMPESLERQLSIISEALPSYWRQIVRRTPREQIFVQPVYDLQLPACAAGRVALAGDAAAVVRPHTGGGAVKALQDAVVLEAAMRKETGWPDVLKTYSAQRMSANSALVKLGRSLGNATVLASPDWSRMTPAVFGQWWETATHLSQANLGGNRLKDL